MVVAILQILTILHTDIFLFHVDSFFVFETLFKYTVSHDQLGEPVFRDYVICNSIMWPY